MGATTAIDRLAMRTRPEGSSVMEQKWENLLFLHWPVEESLLRPLIPAGLEIDTFEGRAWIGITPFSLTGLRLMSLPSLPGFDSFYEINLRTYVHHEGKPGVWFFSLDASKVLATVAARIFFMLPYFNSEIEFAQSEQEFRFEMRRIFGPAAHFKSRWIVGNRLRAPDPESLAFFLTERYALFTKAGDSLYMARVYHHPWILEEANVLSCESNLMKAAGLPEATDIPLAHFSRMVDVQVWPPSRVSSS